MSSPVKRLSSTSMDLPPISPTRVKALASIPSTPVIEAALYLPRLVTSFESQTSSMTSTSNDSLTFQLPTPSPLSLSQTPIASRKTQTSVQYRRRYSVAVEDKDTTMVSLTSSSSTSSVSSDESPNGATHLFCSSLATRRMPTLLRQNANEGLEKLVLEDGSVVNRNLPEGTATLRLNHTACNNFDPPNVSETTLLTPRPRSRSPIAKRTIQRRPSLRRGIAQINIPNATTKLLIRSPVSATTQSRNREINARIAHLSRPLVPLVSVYNGHPHPSFPTTILQYQLLTNEQLDDLARWYHQTSDAGPERWMYPASLGHGKAWIGTETGADVEVSLQTKRRRWGRFIGLRGCESPREVVDSDEDLEARMEQQWREGIRRAREAEQAREKMGRAWF